MRTVAHMKKFLANSWGVKEAFKFLGKCGD